MTDWEYEYDYTSPPKDDFAEYAINPHQSCKHIWKPVLLLYSTVFDCEKCAIHKEDVT